MTELPPGSVTIADLYRELTGLRTDLAAALTKLTVIEDRDRSSEIVQSDHESRIRALERFRYGVAGLSVVGGILSGAVGYWLGHFVK